jgi:hypothetical protein
MSEDTSWFEDKAANDPKRSTIFPLILWAAIVGIVLGAVLYAGKVRADVIFTAEGEGGAIVTLYNEPCRIKTLTNLPYRATWIEKGKTFEGCYVPRTEAGIVLFYFDDGSVGYIPFQMLRKAVSA